MSADNMPRMNDSLIETNYQNIIPGEQMHFNRVQAYSLGNYKTSGLVSGSKIVLNNQNDPQLYSYKN